MTPNPPQRRPGTDPPLSPQQVSRPELAERSLEQRSIRAGEQERRSTLRLDQGSPVETCAPAVTCPTVHLLGSGAIYETCHPDMSIVQRPKVTVAVPGAEGLSGPAEDMANCARRHKTRAESADWDRSRPTLRHPLSPQAPAAPITRKPSHP